jgi:nucleoside-diphosphate-sugar epimerase
MNEVKAGNITGSIARAADFYGATDSMNSFFDSMVLAKLSKQQTLQWLGNPDALHSFTYVPDAAKGMFILGQTPESDNQIWHLPSAAAITGKKFIELAAEAFNARPRFSKINKFLLQLAGIFTPVIKETVEMYYQYSNDYNFNSDKFEKAFNFNPASYQEGFRHLADSYYSLKKT